MAGTKEGGKKSYETSIRLYGEDFFRLSGKLGGRHNGPWGFSDKEVARRAAKRSKRGMKFIKEGNKYLYYVNQNGQEVRYTKEEVYGKD